MFPKENKKAADLEAEVEVLHNQLDKALDAESRAVAELANARDEISRLATANTVLQDRVDQAVEGDVVLLGEDLKARDLVRVLREELECTHSELKYLKESVKSAYKLLEPQLGE